MNIEQASRLCNQALAHHQIYLGISAAGLLDFSGKAVELSNLFASPFEDRIKVEIMLQGHQVFDITLQSFTGHVSADGKDLELHGPLVGHGDIPVHIHIKDWGLHQQGKGYMAYESISA